MKNVLKCIIRKLNDTVKDTSTIPQAHKSTSPQAHKPTSPQVHKPTSPQAHKPTLPESNLDLNLNPNLDLNLNPNLDLDDKAAYLPTSSPALECSSPNSKMQLSGGLGECAPYINQSFHEMQELVNGFKAYQGIANTDVWICYNPDGKWRMQHTPDKGTGKAYAYTEGSHPLGRKTWGVWSNGSWSLQELSGITEAPPPELSGLTERLFNRLCKLLRIFILFMFTLVYLNHIPLSHEHLLS